MNDNTSRIFNRTREFGLWFSTIVFFSCIVALPVLCLITFFIATPEYIPYVYTSAVLGVISLWAMRSISLKRGFWSTIFNETAVSDTHQLSNAFRAFFATIIAVGIFIIVVDRYQEARETNIENILQRRNEQIQECMLNLPPDVSTRSCIPPTPVWPPRS